MKVEPMPVEDVKRLFSEYDHSMDPRDRAFKTAAIRNAFHDYYMKRIEIILDIAAATQKLTVELAGAMKEHYKEKETVRFGDGPGQDKGPFADEIGG